MFIDVCNKSLFFQRIICTDGNNSVVDENFVDKRFFISYERVFPEVQQKLCVMRRKEPGTTAVKHSAVATKAALCYCYTLI